MKLTVKHRHSDGTEKLLFQQNIDKDIMKYGGPGLTTYVKYQLKKHGKAKVFNQETEDFTIFELTKE